MQICNSSLGGFSVVKHLYSLEMALYCYKELWRNILDFWSRFKTKNLRKLHILRLHARSVICIKNRHRIPKRAIRPSQGTFKFLPRRRLTNQTRFLCFNQQQITKELGPGFPRALLVVCHAQKRRALGSRMFRQPSWLVPSWYLKADLHGTTFPHTTSLQQACDMS